MFCWLIISLVGAILYLLPKNKPFAGIYSRPGNLKAGYKKYIQLSRYI
jgi:hypothetical protein